MGDKQWTLYRYYDIDGKYVEIEIEYESWYESAVKSWVCQKIGERNKRIIAPPKKEN